MTTLVRWEPYRELLNMRHDMDRLFENVFTMPTLWKENGEGFMHLDLDVAEQEGKFLVKASVPGIAPEDLDISLSDNVLTIKGETHTETEKEEETYHLRERRSGRFMRSFSLPTLVKEEEIEATYENGVLTLEIPKAEEVKPKKIEVAVKKMLGKK